MQKSDNRQTAQIAHRRAQASTTLNRRYVKRPVKSTEDVVQVKRVRKIAHFNNAPSQFIGQPAKSDVEKAKAHPLQNTVNTRMQARKGSTATASRATASELKDQAIKKALAAANSTTKDQKAQKSKMHFGFGRVMLALACTTAAVLAIVYFVNLNMPDISLKVAAMQTGISASYPGFIPRGFDASGITSEEGKVTLNFKNNSTGDAFYLIEEKSFWDSNALLSNYVKDKYNDNYTVVREQGLTLYISKSDAAWVNGGILYKLITTSGELTNKQIRSIAVSCGN